MNFFSDNQTVVWKNFEKKYFLPMKKCNFFEIKKIVSEVHEFKKSIEENKLFNHLRGKLHPFHLYFSKILLLFVKRSHQLIYRYNQVVLVIAG